MDPNALITKVAASDVMTRGRTRLVTYFGVVCLAAGVVAATDATFAQAPSKPSKVVLQIHKVVCVDETDSGSIIGEHGNDNMILGAVTIAPNGKRAQIRAVSVGKFKEDGDVEPFPKPMQFAAIKVPAGQQREYGVLLVLAEEDVSGGTDDFVAKLLKDANAGIGADDKADGGATAIAGEVAKEIAKELAKRGVERLKQNAKDDIFRPLPVTVVLRESDLLFLNGKTSTAPQTVNFSGHGGKVQSDLLVEARLVTE